MEVTYQWWIVSKAYNFCFNESNQKLLTNVIINPILWHHFFVTTWACGTAQGGDGVWKSKSYQQRFLYNEYDGQRRTFVSLKYMLPAIIFLSLFRFQYFWENYICSCLGEHIWMHLKNFRIQLWISCNSISNRKLCLHIERLSMEPNRTYTFILKLSQWLPMMMKFG